MAPATQNNNNGVDRSVVVKYTKLFIDGEFVDSISGKTFETFDPRTGDAIAKVSEATKEDVDLAVKAARNAFDHGPWPRLGGYERGRILSRYADLIEQHAEELAALETLDGGKPLEDSRRIDVPFSIKSLRYFAGAADKIHGMTLKMSGQFQGYTLHEPIGVAGQIIPWNAPLIMFFFKVGPALACGCTVVIKPAEQTPLTALYCAQLAKEAGIPSGVLNVVSGFGATAGAAISSHMDIDKVAFTGSVPVGRLIMEAAAKSNLKPVTLELGGKSPLIIMNDADIDLAVELAHNGVFLNMVHLLKLQQMIMFLKATNAYLSFTDEISIGLQGQVCCAGSRVFVQEDIYDEFLKKATERAKKQVVGDPFRSDVNQGPQIDKAQFDRILEYIEIGKGEQANLVIGGNCIGDKGFYIEPTIFSEVKDDMKIAQEEIFGPVMSILKFKTVEEAIERGNKTLYGLAAGIVTKDINVANKLARSIRAGIVWINCYSIIDVDCPFGGYKMSGIGREQGLHVLQNYLQVKSVITSLQDSPWI